MRSLLPSLCFIHVKVEPSHPPHTPNLFFQLTQQVRSLEAQQGPNHDSKEAQKAAAKVAKDNQQEAQEAPKLDGSEAQKAAAEAQKAAAEDQEEAQIRCAHIFFAISCWLSKRFLNLVFVLWFSM